MKTILLIDDDPKMLDLLKHYLRKESVYILSAPDGEEGLELFTANAVDLVIIDIFMPNMDGIQTILEIKQKKSDSQILVISGGGEYTGLEYLKQAKALGAKEALVKPFTQEDFLKTAHKMIG
ncbi:Response regulator receiver domain-containing protein [Maridesulfovibrio ferrireducens]|uniref:Response regulator receiver domain-containing protein n=1 Tax=Maridesulfovibrio ferrireducens TaxID=246191 RepID=A0A1G9D337_9BACT|nr:response regulator [Maridesulfovibrio ferrireducens]SDK58321.1 Response regulator receiver domain-containing protein [Maridesulfovibrio ferrireducens]